MVLHILLDYVRHKLILLFEWSKCGDSTISVLPTILWAIGSAVLARRLITSVFKRFMFRRVPPWEIVLQHLVYLWMITYCLHFWALLVSVIKYLVENFYKTDGVLDSSDGVVSRALMEQLMIWLCGVMPLALYVHMRPKTLPPPVMIWVTTNPWHRREMGAYEYYLSRPLTLESSPDLPPQVVLRRVCSDSRTLVKERPRKRRMSKSI